MDKLNGRNLRLSKYENSVGTNRKHWRNSHRINLAVNTMETLSDKSVIHYPELRKTQALPKLAVPQPQACSETREQKTPILLPEIEQEEEEWIDFEWIVLQQRAIETMALQIDKSDRIPIKIGETTKQLPLAIFQESIAIKHLLHCGSKFI
jgi:hypothetical protein